MLDRLDRFIVEFARDRLCRTSPSVDQAMILAQAMTNYYTCLETMFLRISKFFEKGLSSDRWHQSLLAKMTLEIEGVRKRVIRNDVYMGLLEIMKFRHFSRYYLELDYDWDKLLYLLKQYHDLRVAVREDLVAYDGYLRQLAE